MNETNRENTQATYYTRRTTFAPGAEQTFNGKNGAFIFFDWRIGLDRLKPSAYRAVVEAILDFQQYGRFPDPTVLPREVLGMLDFIIPQLERQALMREKGQAGVLRKAEKSNDPEKIASVRQEAQAREQMRERYERERRGFHTRGTVKYQSQYTPEEIHEIMERKIAEGYAKAEQIGQNSKT